MRRHLRPGWAARNAMRLDRGDLSKRDALLIAHTQGRLSQENLLKELERLDCGAIEDRLGGRYPALVNKKRGDIVMFGDTGTIKLQGQKAR